MNYRYSPHLLRSLERAPSTIGMDNVIVNAIGRRRGRRHERLLLFQARASHSDDDDAALQEDRDVNEVMLRA